jgi:hypothetical protein
MLQIKQTSLDSLEEFMNQSQSHHLLDDPKKRLRLDFARKNLSKKGKKNSKSKDDATL